jgi:hypothetical protein
MIIKYNCHNDFSQLKNQIVKKELPYISLDRMMLMDISNMEQEMKKAMKICYEEEVKMFLHDKYEQDQIIENLDNKILQYKQQIRELKSQI